MNRFQGMIIRYGIPLDFPDASLLKKILKYKVDQFFFLSINEFDFVTEHFHFRFTMIDLDEQTRVKNN